MKLITIKHIITLVGGIEIEIYINGNSNLKLNSLITMNRDEYKVSVSVQSKALVDFLEGRK